MALSVTPCGAADLPALSDLYQHLNPDDVRCPPDVAVANLDQLHQWPGCAVLLGRVDGVPVASCTVVVVPNLSRGGAPYALIENVVTHPDHRRRGHGQAILAAAVARAWAQGCYKVMLLTGTSKQGTLDFYVRAGFLQTKTGFQIRR